MRLPRPQRDVARGSQHQALGRQSPRGRGELLALGIELDTHRNRAG
jgi:hypothetical protein